MLLSLQGVLVYSEFAGCASSFKGAMVVNPYDPDRVADTIHTALTMPLMTKKIRHHQVMRLFLRTYK
jgi:trehalose-6-phosphate synthase